MTPPDRPAPAPPALVLASGSPRRRDLLAALGARFEVRPPEVDETPAPGEAPEAMVLRLARDKARLVSSDEPDALVVAADTAVVVDGHLLGKPRDGQENRAFLRRLAGRPHRVVTGHCLRWRGAEETAVVTTRVTLRPLGEAEIERFVARGAGLDKAGGYAIQDAGAALVGEIEGCYSNVVGLSLPAVVAAAARLGVALV